MLFYNTVYSLYLTPGKWRIVKFAGTLQVYPFLSPTKQFWDDSFRGLLKTKPFLRVLTQYEMISEGTRAQSRL